ncbi:SDR family oxidoreductase [soil metagenome]
MSAGPRTVLVVGGTGGLGGAIASAYADAEDAHVTVTGATQAEVDVALDDPRLGRAKVELLDVRDDEAVKKVIAGFSSIDVLVNAAGISASPADFTVEGFTRSIDINVLGTMRACFAAQPLLEASRGCIINFASMMSYRGSATGPAYAAGKGAILQLTTSLAAAWGPHIRVNAIAPGFMDTPMTKNIQADLARNEKILGRIPGGHWGAPEALISAAFFLSSPDSGYVTGITVPVDGGYLTT